MPPDCHFGRNSGRSPVLGHLVRWLRRHHSTLALILTVAIVVTVAFGLIRKGYLDSNQLARSKDAFAALNSLVAILALLLAFSLSYFRFFAGRTFARRAELAMTTDVALAPDGSCLHAISLKLQNVGTLSIYDPELSLIAVDHAKGGSKTTSKVTNWLENGEFASDRLESLIDPGETAHFHATRHVQPGIWSSSYAAVVRDRHGNVWQGFALASAPPAKRPRAVT